MEKSAIFCAQMVDVCRPGHIKTYGHVSAAKKAVWRTNVLLTGTANLLFSVPRISITTGQISIKFTYFMSYIYTTLHTKFERNWFSSTREICVPENCPIFFTFLFFFAPFYKSNFEPTKTTLPMDRFLSNLVHL